MDIVVFLGGLGLFLYGMKLLGDGLEKAAGAKMEKIIAGITGNIWRSMAVGALVTAIIQSSSATTVMIVGFVNAGIMNLTQAVGIIMGANIGTTITAQIIGFSQSTHTNAILNLLKPTTIAPMCVALGAFMLFSKSGKVKLWGEIVIGFGVLFTGMSTMEASVSKMADSESFRGVFAALGHNPLLAVVAGAAVTAIIQSSSASVGILQATAAAGLISCGGAIPVVMGQNIGTCITALLASVGANKTAKKAAFIHLYFNIAGTIVFMIAFYAANAFIRFSFLDNPISSVDIANFHTLFNVVNAIILLPFSKGLVWLADHTFSKDQLAEVHTSLDERMLSAPSIAAAMAFKETAAMGSIAQKACALAVQGMIDNTLEGNNEVYELEDQTDLKESHITRYLVRLVELPLNDEENLLVSNLLHTVTDFERIGDHASSIAKTVKDIVEDDIDISDKAREDLTVISNAALEILNITLDAFTRTDAAAARRIQPLEDVIDNLRNTLKKRHIDRLAKQVCNVKAGVMFLDLIGNLERIADHCSNIGIRIEHQSNPALDLDQHSYKRNVRTADYDLEFSEFKRRFKL